MADLGPKFFDFLLLLALFIAFWALLAHLPTSQAHFNCFVAKIFNFIVLLRGFTQLLVLFSTFWPCSENPDHLGYV